MMLLVKNADVYAPEALGRRDILAAEGRIIAIAEHIDPSYFPCPVEVLEAEGLFALPGLIDSHEGRAKGPAP